MSNVVNHIIRGANVVPIVSAIARHPEFWNKYTTRTEKDYSPHTGLDDIWLRYNAWENFRGSREEFNGPHGSEWYEAADFIPVKPICDALMAAVKGDRLGGVLITRIKPGQVCAPHIDGGWHADTYQKYAVQLEGDMLQAFHFEGEAFSAVPGDIYWFDNSKLHWVTNNSKQDRMTMVVCIYHEGSK